MQALADYRTFIASNFTADNFNLLQLSPVDPMSVSNLRYHLHRSSLNYLHRTVGLKNCSSFVPQKIIEIEEVSER